MGNHAKNQHYVPKMLLRNFSDNHTTIWCYDMKLKKASKRAIKSVASAPYFYDRIAGQKEDSYEYVMGRAETEVAPIIAKVIAAKSLEVLEGEDKLLLALFIALQLFRTQSALKGVELVNEQLKNYIRPLADYYKVEYEEVSARETWLSIFSQTPEFAHILLNKLWFLYESNNEFYSSDNPIVKQNWHNRNSNRGVLGLNSDGIEIYFPLNPSLLLALYCERTFAQVKGIKMPPAEPENIENANALQVLNSHRFIFSFKNKFDLIEDMIAKGEVTVGR